MILFLYFIGGVIAFGITARSTVHEENVSTPEAFLLSISIGLIWPFVTAIAPFFLLFRFVRDPAVQRRKEEKEVEEMLKEGPKL